MTEPTPETLAEWVRSTRPAAEASLGAEAQARLAAFASGVSQQFELIAVEVVELWARDQRLAGLGPVASDRASLVQLVGSWIRDSLTAEGGNERNPGPKVPEPLRDTLALPGAHSTLLRGLALARRRLLESCVRFDPALSDQMLAALDLEAGRIFESYQQVIATRVATLEKLAELGQLVASVGHELRNPLSSIETSAYLLSRRISGPAASDPGIDKHLDKIRRNVDAASRMVNALLGWAKQRTPCFVQTELHACLGPVLRDLKRPDAVRIEVELPERLELCVDVDLIRILLGNLLSNAIESVGESGLVRVVACDDASGTSIQVSDDGPGIAEQDQAHLFELLHTTKCHGVGLGLPLCQRIAQAHGGRLGFDSSGEGASFRLWLPHRLDPEWGRR